jgi:NADPH:quinone reductase-like Zn-dependent oxidoreductase
LTARRAAVTATASSQDKLDVVTSGLPQGATAGVNYKTQDFAKEVERATGGHGADVVIDFVGASHWDKNIAALAPDGRMVMLSFLSGRKLEKVDLGPLLFKRLRIQGTRLRARSVPYQADLVERFTRDVVGKLTGAEGYGELKTYVHKVFPWTEIRAAHEEMEGNKNSGKIIVEVQ